MYYAEAKRSGYFECGKPNSSNYLIYYKIFVMTKQHLTTWVETNIFSKKRLKELSFRDILLANSIKTENWNKDLKVKNVYCPWRMRNHH